MTWLTLKPAAAPWNSTNPTGLNAGAYTAVDKAESEPELAHAVNAGAPEAFARALDQQGGRLLQISTDFVFNGTQGTPYQPEQARDPLGVDGASKAAGEAAVQSIFGAGGRGLILRTSWVIGPVGKNFALTMLRLHRERDQLGVCLLYTSPSPRDRQKSRMPSSA